MSSTDLAILILALLLGATLLTPLLARFGLRRFAHLPAVIAFASASVVALVQLRLVFQTGPAGPTPGLALDLTASYPFFDLNLKDRPTVWFSAGLLKATFSLTIDPLSTRFPRKGTLQYSPGPTTATLVRISSTGSFPRKRTIRTSEIGAKLSSV